MDAETVKSDNNTVMMAQTPPVMPAEAPGQQSISECEHRPLLKVDRTGGMAGARHFLIPVDDTEDSEKSLHWAIENLYRSGDIFHLLHVIPEPKMIHIWAGVYIPPDEDAELLEIEDTKEFVKHRFLQALLAAKIPFQLHVILGPIDSEAVAKVIAKKVKDLNADAVVMAKHSKGKLKGYWLGSVTKELLKRVDMPVAVVPHGI